MFVRVGNKVYRRQALTPEQKKLKKKYVLKQQMKDDKIPSFEEVWEYQRQFGDIESRIEDYVYDYTWTEADEDDVLKWLGEQGIEVPEEPNYPSDEWEEWKRAVGELVNQHQETVSQALSEAAALEDVKQYVQRLYNDTVYRIEEELEGKGCWRTVNLPIEIDPTKHGGLGIYWAYEESAAEAHWGGSSKSDTLQVTYPARIDTRYIDKEGTILTNTDESLGEEEKEVRFYSGAPLYVYDVTIHGSGWKFLSNKNTVLDINDWRTT